MVPDVFDKKKLGIVASAAKAQTTDFVFHGECHRFRRKADFPPHPEHLFSEKKQISMDNLKLSF